MEANLKVHCTGCGYCLPCPAGVDIPTCFSCLNDVVSEGKWGARKAYLMQTGMKIRPAGASACVGCGRCEPKCPQGVAIRRELAKVRKSMESLYYKPARGAIKLFMRFRGRKG